MADTLHGMSPPFTWATERGEFRGIAFAGPGYRATTVSRRVPGEWRYHYMGRVDGDAAAFDTWRIRETGFVPLPDDLRLSHTHMAGGAHSWDVLVGGWLLVATERADGTGYVQVASSDGEHSWLIEESSGDLALHRLSVLAHIVQIVGSP